MGGRGRLKMEPFVLLALFPPFYSQINLFRTKAIFHSTYRYREILFSNHLCYEFGQTVPPPITCGVINILAR